MPTIFGEDDTLMKGFKMLNDSMAAIQQAKQQDDYRQQMALMAGIREKQNEAVNDFKDKKLTSDETIAGNKLGQGAKNLATTEAGKNARLQESLAVMQDLKQKALDNGDKHLAATISAGISKMSLDDSLAGTVDSSAKGDVIVKHAGLKGSSEEPIPSTKKKVGSTAEPTQYDLGPFHVNIGTHKVDVTYAQLLNTLNSETKAKKAAKVLSIIDEMGPDDKDRAAAVDSFHKAFPELKETLGF